MASKVEVEVEMFLGGGGGGLRSFSKFSPRFVGK